MYNPRHSDHIDSSLTKSKPAMWGLTFVSPAWQVRVPYRRCPWLNNASVALDFRAD